MSDRTMICEVDLDTFGHLYPEAPTVFDTVAFCRLNESKAERLSAFVLLDEQGSPLAGQIMGLRGGEWRAPFSAPFSEISGDRTQAPWFYSKLRNYIGGPIALSCAPDCYGFDHSAFIEKPFEVKAVEANFHYPLTRFEDYRSHLSRSARYNHNLSMRSGFGFELTQDIGRAYEVIEANRRAMCYPLAMGMEDVVATEPLVGAKFFVLTYNGADVAAAMVYDVTPKICQLIYWGDLPHVRRQKAMNNLAYRLFEWFVVNRPEVEIIDIGPASTMGVRNEGLCEFKKSIGCIESPKLLLSI